MLNKTALVTGASGGLGREIVHALGKAGCKLILVGRNESKLKELASEVGFSDHTLVSRDGIKAAVAALYYGADVIERHFTILESDQTKDGPVSITHALLKELVGYSRMAQDELKEYIKKNIPEYETMLGNNQRKLSKEELLNRDYYRGRFATKTTDGRTIYNWE